MGYFNLPVILEHQAICDHQGVDSARDECVLRSAEVIGSRKKDGIVAPSDDDRRGQSYLLCGPQHNRVRNERCLTGTSINMMLNGKLNSGR